MNDLADQIKAQMPIRRMCEKLGIEFSRANDREGWALCPFHVEQTASFHVDFEKGLWFCQGACREGGDVITLWEKVRGLIRGDGLLDLASELNIELATVANFQPLRKPLEAKEKRRREKPRLPKKRETRQPRRREHFPSEFWAWCAGRCFLHEAVTNLIQRGRIEWAGNSLRFVFEGAAKYRHDLEDSGSSRWTPGADLSENVWCHDRLDDPVVKNVVVLEGETDLIGLASAFPENDETAYVAAPGASWKPSDMLAYRIAAHRNVFLCGDNDPAGQNFNADLSELFIASTNGETNVLKLGWGKIPDAPPKADVDWLRVTEIYFWECFEEL